MRIWIPLLCIDPSVGLLPFCSSVRSIVQRAAYKGSWRRIDDCNEVMELLQTANRTQHSPARPRFSDDWRQLWA